MFINNALRDEIGALNASKGWHDEPRSIAQHCILLHSEVSEIVEDYRSNKEINYVWYEYEGFNFEFPTKSKIKNGELLLGKPCGIPSELADVVIRALDMAYEYEFSVGVVRTSRELILGYEDFTFTLAEIHKSISEIFTTNCNGTDEGVEYRLNILIGLCVYSAKRWNINLEQQIQDKLAYNRTRPIKHGGKRL